MKRMMSMLIAVALWGCGAPVDFKQGFPSQEMTSVNMPQQRSGQMGSAEQGLQGDQSGIVFMTRLSIAVVNGTTAGILGALKSVTEQPATSMQGDQATWGPYTPDLSPTTWKLEASRSGANSFNYKLEGKQKSQPDSAYQVVLSGTHVATGVEGFGNGNFLIDWKALASVGGNPNQTASDAAVTYSHLSATAPTTVNVEFQSVEAGSTIPKTTATYHYKSTPNVGGEFSFGVDFQAWWEQSKPTDHWSIKSRWQTTGAGRADAILTGPNLSAPATETECWDLNFASQYLTNSAAPSQGYGNASVCAFSTAEYAQ